MSDPVGRKGSSREGNSLNDGDNQDKGEDKETGEEDSNAKESNNAGQENHVEDGNSVEYRHRHDFENGDHFGDPSHAGGVEEATVVPEADGNWWPPLLEAAFREALAQFPTCEHCLSCSRLIARYVQQRTGCRLTKSQVSRHLLVVRARERPRTELTTPPSVERRGAAMRRGTAPSPPSPPRAQRVSSVYRQPGLGVLGTRAPEPPAYRMPPTYAPNAAPFAAQFSRPLYPTGRLPPAMGLGSSGPRYYPFAPPRPPVFPPPLPFGHEAMIHLPHLALAPYGPELPLKLLELAVFVEERAKIDNMECALHRHVVFSFDTERYLAKRLPSVEALLLCQVFESLWRKERWVGNIFDRGPRDRFFIVKAWPNLDAPLLDDPTAFFGIKSRFQSERDFKAIHCCTKVFCFDRAMLSTIETERSRFSQGHFTYRFKRRALCGFLTSLIRRLRALPGAIMRECLLDNVTILQIVTSQDQSELLLCLAYVFCRSPGWPLEDPDRATVLRLVEHTPVPRFSLLLLAYFAHTYRQEYVL